MQGEYELLPDLDGDLDLSSPIYQIPIIPVKVDLESLGYLLAVPTLSMLMGSILIFFVNPGPKTFAGMQHLAAGLILGAVLWELGPEMNHETHGEKQAVCLGFILGFAGLMFMARFDLKLTCGSLSSQHLEEQRQELASTCSSHTKEEDFEDFERTTHHSQHSNSMSVNSPGASSPNSDGSQSESRQHISPVKTPKQNPSDDEIFSTPRTLDPSIRSVSHGSPTLSPLHELPGMIPEHVEKTHLLEKEEAPKIPYGLIAAVWVNGAIDGLLIGIAFVTSGTAGLITSIALGIEQGLLGITTTKSLTKKFSSTATFILAVLLVLPIPIFGMIAGKFLNGLSGEIFACINAFGLSGLLYLVTEELLIEAHEEEATDKWYVSIHTFTGFLIVILLHEFLS